MIQVRDLLAAKVDEEKFSKPIRVAEKIHIELSSVAPDSQRVGKSLETSDLCFTQAANQIPSDV